MHVDVRSWLEGIVDVDQPGISADPTAVPNLATRLAIERRAVQNHLDRVARFRVLHRSVRADDSKDPCVGGGRLIAEELGRPLGQIDVDLSARAGSIAERINRSTPANLTLRGKRLVKPGLVNFQTLLAGQLDGQIERKPIRVVEPEDLAPRQDAGDGLSLRGGIARQIFDQRLKARHPRTQRSPEGFLFVGQHLLDLDAAVGELAMMMGKLIDYHSGDHGQERLLEPKFAASPNGASQNAAQHIGPAFVPGQHPVRDQERTAPHMVGDDAQRPVDFWIAPVGDAGQFGHMLDDRLVEVNVVDRLYLLHDHDQPLETHTGVDVLPGEWGAGAIRELDELHEDVVPDLQIPLTIATGCTVRRATAMLRAAVVVDLRIGAIRPGCANRTPPVVVEPADALVRNSDHVAPDAQRVLVVGMHGREEAILRNPQVPGQELPGPLQRLPLEVIADGKVTQHEEERAVTLVADLVNVHGAEALLNRDHALRGRLFQSHEVGCHLLHAGRREQDRGIVVWDERRRRHLAVTALREELDEAASQLLAGYGRGHRQVTRHGSGTLIPSGAGNKWRDRIVRGYRTNPGLCQTAALQATRRGQLCVGNG